MAEAAASAERDTQLPSPSFSFPSRFSLLLSLLHFLLHVVTSSQHFSHFFLHVNGRLHVTHVLTGRLLGLRKGFGLEDDDDIWKVPNLRLNDRVRET